MGTAGPPQELSQQTSQPTSVVQLSYFDFTVWWVVIFAVHTVTCVYNALYAYCYWELKNTFVYLYLDFYHIGMPRQHHSTIVMVHAIMSTIHGVCIALMLGGSFWQRSLAFTPWSSSQTSNEPKAARTNQSNVFLQSLARIYDKITYPCGVFGVKGRYFEVAVVCREIVETALQTVQAYRMSELLPRAVLNQFYAILLVINCWSSVIVDTVFAKHSETHRRFACVTFDCALDLMACMGVELIVLLSYSSEYERDTKSFSSLIWYNDEWVARALNEFQMVFVVSWSDLASRVIFSLGLAITTTSMKKLLEYRSRSGNRVIQAPRSNVIAVQATHSKELIGSTIGIPSRTRVMVSKCSKHTLTHIIHLLFVVWGVLVLGLHVNASLQPSLPQCLMQVRPWTATLSSCYLVALDCHTLAISGTMKEVEMKWREFDASTVVQLLIRHCPALEVPSIFSGFERLRGIKVYNTTIIDWGESAALSNANHPEITSLFIVRVNMTNGLLPKGFQSSDFPRSMNDIELCVTNLRELPDDLDTKWPVGTIIQVEYSHLTALPASISKLNPFYLVLTGNPITELPVEIFGIEGLVYLDVSQTNILELPQHVAKTSSSLSLIAIDNTEISFFWSWVDELVGRVENPAVFVAGVTPYCATLENIGNGLAANFSIQFSAEYSAILMNASQANRQNGVGAVDCTYVARKPYYPLAYEDSINALETPMMGQ